MSNENKELQLGSKSEWQLGEEPYLLTIVSLLQKGAIFIFVLKKIL